MTNSRKLATGTFILMAVGVPFLGAGMGVYLPILAFTAQKIVISGSVKRNPLVPMWLQFAIAFWTVHLMLSAVIDRPAWYAMVRDFAWVTSPWFSYLAGMQYRAIVDKKVGNSSALVYKVTQFYLLAAILMVILNKGNVFVLRDSGFFGTSLPFILISISMVPGISISMTRDILGWLVALVSMSRLTLVSALPGYLFRQASPRRIFIAVGSLLVIGGVGWWMLTLSASGQIFLTKIQEMSNEISSANIESINDAYLYWRPFELLTAINYYLGLPLLRLLFGNGLGAMLPLGAEFTLGGSPYTEIPILHNGISYLFLKSGFMGLFVTGWLLKKSIENLPSRLQFCLWIYLILGAYTITGPCNPQFAFLFFMLPLWKPDADRNQRTGAGLGVSTSSS